MKNLRQFAFPDAAQLPAGFQVHLAKPVKAEALMAAVANLTQRK